MFDSFKRLLPRGIVRVAAPLYHFFLAFLGAVLYRFPSHQLIVVGITGTKGKTSVTELLGATLRESGYHVATSSTLQFTTDGESTRNTSKMTTPGRFFLQRFMRRALQKGCTHAVIEMSSESTLQSRHRFIELDMLIFTNIAPEHIESHGSFEKYLAAKLAIAGALARSLKHPTTIVANADDAHGKMFLGAAATRRIPFSYNDARDVCLSSQGSSFLWEGVGITSALHGEYALYNLLAALTAAKALGVPVETAASAISTVDAIAGRGELLDSSAPFKTVIDYAHTPESLEAIYKAFQGTRRICVLGSCGGGRDRWKRPTMGTVAERYCDMVFLTNEDPYDEDPYAIIDEVAQGISDTETVVEIDRRAAIKAALACARPGDVVLITGKGTDPYIMGARGAKVPWSDKDVAREVLGELGYASDETLSHEVE